MMRPDIQLADHVLITRCQLRDRQALAELIGRYERPVRYFIRRLVADPDLAEELLRALLGKEQAGGPCMRTCRFSFDNRS